MPVHPVVLHIYDLHRSFRGANVFLKALGTGFFHVGLEVHGKEWSFRSSASGEEAEVSGIFDCAPQGCDSPSGHAYKESLVLGETCFSHDDVDMLVNYLASDWKMSGYDLIRRNCCHFCDVLSMALGAGHVPPWLCSAAAALRGPRCICGEEDPVHLKDLHHACTAAETIKSLQAREPKLASIKRAKKVRQAAGRRHSRNVKDPSTLSIGGGLPDALSKDQGGSSCEVMMGTCAQQSNVDHLKQEGPVLLSNRRSNPALPFTWPPKDSGKSRTADDVGHADKDQMKVVLQLKHAEFCASL
ncbi:desi2 [Symbiodinium natans]|uniref:Desi2 protein n=1 Tax=Symbiodinium natans TaxID=878477 RepID=A0A812MNC4_9DINO|nr:desi2 [Symbiodinium natans]